MFGFLRRKQGGWLAVGFYADRIDFAHVERSAQGRPRLLRLESYARAGDDAQTLALLAKKKGFAAYSCTTLLAPGNYQVLPVEAPEVGEAELREALRWQLKDSLEFPAEAATIDVLQLPVGQMPGRALNIIAVAGNNLVLAPCIARFDQSGMDLQAVDIPEMAQRNIAALFETENRGLAMLTFDASGGMLTFTYHGELCVSRRIEITSTQLAEADEGRRSALYERIGLELQRSLDNFERQYTMISVAKVLVGLSAVSTGLIESLRDLVYVPIEVADLSSVIDCDAVPEVRQPVLQGERFCLIGAALRDVTAGGKA